MVEQQRARETSRDDDSDASVRKSAEKLHEALTHENWFGLHSAPQEGRVKAILTSLDKVDHRQLEITYHELYGKDGPKDTLRQDLDDKLNETDFRRAEAMLNRHDGKANDAGELKVALAQLGGDDKDAATGRILQVFSTLNQKDIATMRGDFQRDYGQSMDEALKNADLSDTTRKALGVLLRGSDARTPKDNEDLARLAVEGHCQQLLSIALRGDGDAARGARDKLNADPKFKDQLGEAFPENHAVTDYLREGRISLATIADKDQAKFLGFGENKDNFELALTNIADSEREKYRQGRRIHDSNRCPAGKEEQEAFEYYERIHDGLNKMGDDREVSRWQDMIETPGGTLISRMADKHDHKDQVFAAAESMSEDDWKRLTDEKTGPQFRKDIEESVTHYLDESEQQRLMRILDGKAAAHTYEEARKVTQPLLDIIGDGDASQTVDRLLHLDPHDRSQYQTNACFRQEVDDKLKDIDGPGGVLMRHLMQQVAENGSLPQLDPIDQVLYDKVKDAPAGQFIKDTQVALEDEQLRARLRDNRESTDKLPERERELLSSISDFLREKDPPPLVAGRGGAVPAENEKLDTLLNDGRLKLSDQMDLEVPISYVYTQLSRVSADERDEALGKMGDGQKDIAQNVLKQNGELTLADQFRSFVIDGGSDFKTFIEPLKQAHSDGTLEHLKDEYAAKYKHDLADDLHEKLGGADEDQSMDLLNPAGTPAREDFYQILDGNGPSGISPDGTELTRQRAIDEFATTLEKYQSQYKDLPDHERHKLDAFFAEADKQYKESKEAFAKFVVNAALVGTAVIAAPFTGGLSLGGVAAIAAAGAAFRTGATWAIEGDDFDGSPENVMKEAFLGAGQTGFTFLGPSAFAGMTTIGKDAAEHAAAAMVASEGKELLVDGAENGLRKQLETMYYNATIRGENITNKQLEEVAAKFTRQGADPKEVAQLLKATSQKEIESASQKYLLESLKQKGKAEVREAAFNGSSTAALNVTNNVVSAPFDGGLTGDGLKDSVVTGVVGGTVVAPLFKGAFYPVSHATENFVGQPLQKATRRAVNEEITAAEDGGQVWARLQRGDRVSWNNEPGWKVKGFDEDGNLVIAHDAERQVDPPDVKKLQEGWEVDSLDVHTGKVNVVKVDAERHVIKRRDVIAGNTPLALEEAS